MQKMYILICCLLVTCMLGACGEQKLADITEDMVSKETKIQESSEETEVANRYQICGRTMGISGRDYDTGRWYLY